MNDAARFVDWKTDEEAAEAIVPMVGRLYREHGVVTLVDSQRLVLKGPTEIIQAHRRGHRRFGHDIALTDTLAALEALAGLDLAPVSVDVGKLLVERAASGTDASVASFITERCGDLPKLGGKPLSGGRDVVLYGFGRIGRILARQLVERAGGGEKYNLKAIVVRKKAEDDLERRANLLRHDSVHGEFRGIVRTVPEENALMINGCKVHLIYSNSPEETEYAKYGISDAIVIDNTGIWRDDKGLGRHLQADGVSTVILTAPGKGDVPNIVFGVNDDELPEDARIISAASCTTNAIVPTLKAMNDKFGIVSGHIETVHAYTNDQNLLDNYHKKTRRGRSAALNLVITETGAAKAAAKALPFLKGKLTASAIRVPTPNVSLAIMNLELSSEVTRESVNAYLYETASASALQDQIGWTSMSDTVSSDLVGNPFAGIVDGEATIGKDRNAVVYVWYDNEFGYCTQVMRLLGRACQLERPNFP